MAWTDRLINLFRGRQLACEIDEELSFHIESRVRDNVAMGMTPEEAAADARARFGNRTVTRERMRDANMDAAPWFVLFPRRSCSKRSTKWNSPSTFAQRCAPTVER